MWYSMGPRWGPAGRSDWLPDMEAAEVVVKPADARPHHSHGYAHVVRSIGGPLDVLVSLAHLLGALEFRSCIDRLGDGLGVP